MKRMSGWSTGSLQRVGFSSSNEARPAAAYYSVRSPSSLQALRFHRAKSQPAYWQGDFTQPWCNHRSLTCRTLHHYQQTRCHNADAQQSRKPNDLTCRVSRPVVAIFYVIGMEGQCALKLSVRSRIRPTRSKVSGNHTAARHFRRRTHGIFGNTRCRRMQTHVILAGKD